MAYAVVSVSLAALLALVVWLARRSGVQEEQRGEAEHVAEVKDKQLEIAARPRADRAELLNWMRKKQ